MRQRMTSITKWSVVLAGLTGLCWLAGFDVPSAHAQGYMQGQRGSSGFGPQGRAPMMSPRGGMTGMAGRGGMHGGYRPGWGHRGMGMGYGLPLGVIGAPYRAPYIEAPYRAIERNDDPVESRQSRRSRRKTAVRERKPRKPSTAVTASGMSYVRYAPNTYPACAHGDGAMSGECNGRPFVADLGGDGPPPRDQNSGPRRNAAQAAVTRNYLPGEIVAEIAAMPDGALAVLARRHRLERMASQNFPLTGSTVSLFRIVGRRTVGQVQAELRADAAVRSAQPNFRYVLQDQKTTGAVTEGDPAQYALAKLRLPEAHALAHGKGIVVAVIDSAIDADHPELAGSIAASFDALDSKDGPHVHGTGIAGAIVAHARLMGSAPSAKILAIRAFGVTQGAAESTSFTILRSLDYAATHGAQIINMSFAGPKDALVSRGIAAAATKGIVMVAASGNAGPKSPPLYPAADADVIAVSATDVDDRLFAASNRGGHIAVAAPGVDIFLPAPGGKYQMTSGTSFSAAYVSGLAALILERNPALEPADVRAILTTSARDLGAPGRDDLFGAGEADAYGAVQAVPDGAVPAGTVPVMAVSDPAPAAAASDAAATTTGEAAPASEPQPAPAGMESRGADPSAK
ncbi:peptidase S8 and S53, subtilisin, kexin, sedolisin [Nitrobacter hamburgensis X14]|uniref:Peptidase S8 and S53, subtilisin, kexin, sedolisin n=1 Tax=Nitrobacter hamburgensis (strain DSM 10229 / NCIMB 13809 / X14) TaxID=323097 RepID=Q1QK11_NITHX|nr:S8 family serine peptidase [Nitrobacter hamburgensis]ABE63436.1 peptidase S8 and S53, subtilisin, kexin, sedolisin [Nitrobacter hamburgensis X14]